MGWNHQPEKYHITGKNTGWNQQNEWTKFELNDVGILRKHPWPWWEFIYLQSTTVSRIFFKCWAPFLNTGVIHISLAITSRWYVEAYVSLMAATNSPECLNLKLGRWGVVPDTFLASESMKDTESDG